MRVLAYADSGLFSGAEAVHCDLVRGLDASAKIELRCAAPRSNRALAKCLEEATGETPVDVPPQRLSAAALDLYSPRRRAAVGRVLAGVPCDVLFVNLPSAEYGPTPLLAKRWPSTRTIGLLHVPGAFGELGFRFGRLRERLAHRAMSRFDAFCVIVESARHTVERLWGRPGVPIHLIPLPMPQVKPISRDEARSKLGLPGGTVIGIAGRISFKQKGQDTFAGAAASLLEAKPDLHFAVAGEGRDLPQLREMIGSLRLESRVSLLGQVEPIDVFLSAIDMIAIPSRFEGLPLIALEALASGVPGVAADIDGLSDVWPQPWRVAPGDPKALAGGLASVMEMPAVERSRLVKQGRERAAANTSPDPASALEAAILETANG